MATKLYLHREGVGTLPSGTLPSTEQSSLTPDSNLFDNEDGSENRLMDTTISAQAQTSLTNTSTGDTGTHNYYIARWVSPKIDDTSVSANTWTVEFAASESNAAANFPRNGAGAMRVCAYVWKPSNGTKYGNIIDGNSNADGEEAGTSQTVISYTFSGAAVNSLTAGDAVIIFEMWAVVTQGNGTQRTQTVFYDGTTENSTSNEAAWISTPQNLNFTVENQNYTRTMATETVSISEGLTRKLDATRAQSTESTTISENIVRSQGQTRQISESAIVVGESLTRKLDATRNPQETTSIVEDLARQLSANRALYFPSYSISLDGDNDFVNCGNHASLWSQALTKFSFTCWVYFKDLEGGDIVIHGINEPDGGFYLRANGTDINFGIIDDTGSISNVIAEGEHETGVWKHIACTYDNDTGDPENQIIYIDAVESDSTDPRFTMTESANLTLSTAGFSMNIFIKDFRFWDNKKLTPTEVVKVRDNDPTAPTPDYWLPMEEGTGDPVDSISGSLTGSLQNGASWELNSPSVWYSGETVTINDGGIVQAVHGFVRTMETEVVTIGETLTRKLDAIRTLPETIIIQDTLTRMLAATRAIATESVEIGENLVRLLAAQRILSDTTAVLDNLSRIVSATRTSIENISVLDSLERKLEAFRTIGQTVTISDLLETLFQSGGGGAQNYTRTITEDTSISDTLTRMLEAFRTSSDTTVVDESINRTYSASRPIEENISIIDSLERKLDAFRTNIENISIMDSLSLQLSAFRTIVENVGISDSLDRTYNAFRTNIENIAVIDSLDRKLDAFRTLVQTTSISDLLEHLKQSVGNQDFVVNLVENISISDSIKTLLSPIKLFKKSIGSFASEGVRTVREGRKLSPNSWRNSFYTFTHTRNKEHSDNNG